MAERSDFDFVGGYDYKKEAGLLHVADHHFSPGKKQWTWGCGEFGKAWDRNLTDEDGPYIELMTGVYTENQPGQKEAAVEAYREAEQASPLYCFPNKLEDIAVLKAATAQMEHAFVLDQTDTRVFLELDQLYKKTGTAFEIRLKNFEEHMDIIVERDDAMLELVTLYNLVGNYQKAYDTIMSHQFRPWEGAEGRISGLQSLQPVLRESIPTKERLVLHGALAEIFGTLWRMR